jgi:glycosyltransferase involved in cell wall biosynthesis
MTGHCVHPLECERWRTGCGLCPDLNRNFAVWSDTTAMVWRAKQRLYARAPVTLVVASRWMRDRIVESPLLRSWPCHIIPFGLDLDLWRPGDRAACRARIGLPADARVLAFRLPIGERQHRTKGIAWLFEALRRLPPDRTKWLLVFEGAQLPADLRARFSVLEMGWVQDPARVAEALSAADLFLMPSTAESFGLMALEAMACGTPPVVTAGTALVDTTHAPEAGTAVPMGDSEALAAAISRLLADDALREQLARRGREIVGADHRWDDYVGRHLELYRELRSRGPLDPGAPGTAAGARP